MKAKEKAGILVNLLIIIGELWGLILCGREIGAGLLVYFTEDSNILALIACIVSIVRAFAGKKSGKTPPWITVLKYAATNATTLTFLVVVFILIPMDRHSSPANLLFGGSMLFHHTLCPILMLVSFILLENEASLSPRSALLALLPTLVYAAVSVPLNVLRVWRGPYPFLYVYEQSVWASALWFIVIVGGSFCIALLIRFLRKQCSAKNEKTKQ